MVNKTKRVRPEESGEVQPIKVCQIGLGQHGFRQALALMDDPSRWCLTTVIDPSVASYLRFKNQRPDANVDWFRTIDDAVRGSGFCAVVVSTTAPSHVGICKDLISKTEVGYVLVEKPISTSVNQGRCLQALIKERGWQGTIAVDFLKRGSWMYQDIRDLTRSGDLGYLVEAVYSSVVRTSMRGSHEFDFMNWVVGESPIQVTADLEAISHTDHRGARFFDPVGQVEVQYQSGIRFILDGRRELQGYGEGLTMKFERGEIFVDIDQTCAVIRDEKGRRLIHSDKVGRGLNWFINVLDSLVRESKANTPCTLDEAINGLEILVGAHLSSADGGSSVSLPLNSELWDVELRIA